jgi:hypothetical protein
MFLGTIAVSILFFTATFLLKDLLSGAYSGKIKAVDILNIKRSLVLFGVSLLFVFINLLATYNWFVSGVDRAIKKSNFDLSALGDEFQYRKRAGSMGFWGAISWLTGWLAGIVLFVGISIYVIGIWSIFDVLLNLK